MQAKYTKRHIGLVERMRRRRIKDRILVFCWSVVICLILALALFNGATNGGYY